MVGFVKLCRVEGVVFLRKKIKEIATLFSVYFPFIDDKSLNVEYNFGEIRWAIMWYVWILMQMLLKENLFYCKSSAL